MLNKYKIKNDIVEIEVKENLRKEICIVDLESFEKIKKINKTLFLFKEKLYIYFVVNRKKIRLHRFLTNCPKDLEVDHINRNILDNRICNLRVCDKVINTQNTIHQKNSKTKMRGVYFDKKRNKYRGYVQVNNERKFLGWFDDIEECAKKVDKFRKDKMFEYNQNKDVI